MCDYNQLFDNLSWAESIEIQNEAINKLSECLESDEVSQLIRGTTKPCWHNAVLVFKKLAFLEISLQFLV